MNGNDHEERYVLTEKGMKALEQAMKVEETMKERADGPTPLRAILETSLCRAAMVLKERTASLIAGAFERMTPETRRVFSGLATYLSLLPMEEGVPVVIYVTGDHIAISRITDEGLSADVAAHFETRKDSALKKPQVEVTVPK